MDVKNQEPWAGAKNISVITGTLSCLRIEWANKTNEHIHYFTSFPCGENIENPFSYQY